jgi:hypothetical protein
VTTDAPVAAAPADEDPERIVCHCFGHRVVDVQRDARTHGRSTIAADVLAACRAGQARCAETNPLGRCCLGQMRSIALRVQAKGSAT